MELTQPAVIALIDYLYTGCLQASSSIMVLCKKMAHPADYSNLQNNCSMDKLLARGWPIHLITILCKKMLYGQSPLQEAGPSS